jgi:PAS domain-containing protein
MRDGQPQLRLVHDAEADHPGWIWFCGRCASAREDSPAPAARVCPACGWGLLLETRRDLAPAALDAFLVLDGTLRVQALSRGAERLLGVEEESAVNRSVNELLVGADAEPGARGSLAGTVAAVVGGGADPATVFVRPRNTFGVRMRARIGACGPPRAALVVLDAGSPPLRGA